jgi:hypothetical protein
MAKKKTSDERSRAEALRVFERALRKALKTPPELPRAPKKKAKRRK